MYLEDRTVSIVFLVHHVSLLLTILHLYRECPVFKPYQFINLVDKYIGYHTLERVYSKINAICAIRMNTGINDIWCSRLWH